MASLQQHREIGDFVETLNNLDKRLCGGSEKDN